MSTVDDAVELPEGSFVDVNADTVLAAETSISWLEMVSVVAIVALADVAVYRGHGFAGWAALLAATPPLILLGSPRRSGLIVPFLIGVMLWTVALRLVWCGGPLTIGTGLALLPAFVLALAGRLPYVFDVLGLAARLIPSGYRGFSAWGREALHIGRRFAPAQWISTVLPLGAGCLFASLFLMANPDLVAGFNRRFSLIIEALRDWIVQYSAWEALFWFGVAWLAIALMRPLLPGQMSAASRPEARPASSATAPDPLYAAFRNTLLVVIVLFGAYLVFEFQTLWFRTFPEGFHYSGYAHEGAAWLTMALALSTAVLSLIFRGRMQSDSRSGRLRTLAAIWSAQNLILAAAVYHRLSIYVEFNGLTRMRFVGYFGVTAVVVGFLLVVIKIARRKDFHWLLQRQLWTLSLSVYLFTITPVDYLSMAFNARRVLAGDPAPSVQFSVQPLPADALLPLEPLLECENETVREGIRALFLHRVSAFEHQARLPAGRHWTAFQLADREFVRRLRLRTEDLGDGRSIAERDASWQRFVEYAYRWY